MTTKSEWQAANRALMAEDRRRLGEPPTAEEVLAYTRGTLPAHEAAKVCERLVAYPELVRTLTAEFPVEPASAGDSDYMPDEEFARQWASLQKRLPAAPDGGRVLPFRTAITAIAATVAVVFGTLFWQARTEQMRPRVLWDQQDLVPDGGQRGGDSGAVTLTAEGESFLLVVPPPPTPVFDAYRLEIVDVSANPAQSLWSSERLPRRTGDIPILVRRSFFKSGKYRVVLYGARGSEEERLTTYTLRVPGN